MDAFLLGHGVHGLLFHQQFIGILVPGFCGFKQLLWTSNDFYIKFGEIITYHSIGICSELWSLMHVSKQKSEFWRVHVRFCIDPHYTDT